ncbi:large conductance mechanosensitive channel protein MscL [Thiolapillus sp.]|uniref:large conductance mechanosensitive channel protein MscL n=1 Tax=Thiolapillus sp. TaxID=2017437 RepID=UPI003AF6ABA1
MSEFKEFALKGNMVDMAVGIIIGGAFGTIVKSLVSDVIMPPIGYLTGGLDFSSLSLSLGKGLDGKEVFMAPQQNLWVAEVGLRQMIRSVLSGCEGHIIQEPGKPDRDNNRQKPYCFPPPAS